MDAVKAVKDYVTKMINAEGMKVMLLDEETVRIILPTSTACLLASINKKASIALFFSLCTPNNNWEREKKKQMKGG